MCVLSVTLRTRIGFVFLNLKNRTDFAAILSYAARGHGPLGTPYATPLLLYTFVNHKKLIYHIIYKIDIRFI